ncbi:3-octaprenyl 4-hydroxybenzoate carboxylyase UbiX [Gottschalkia acidurici 9a]|uniref:Flavin prenyltransferase UbiX n=1 Tax=Gottschalkia acidurici (strain ATCC 7906 / DSM 604 / BCRC 14475 / CIP 104303 / KCTC 5404 / NCIMB 10678 / 9a) TaxID=1128398 RepID=K0B433_GOTA9|nr:UbiX family flavin prenyltransferase [Gottschalkia acidurici]AFS79877.1 3-octaprenyl 4-hydroxybenzoate carboxylyase UbiX [Gottschalkia acidurici 9a]
MRVVVGISGGSGAIYGVALLKILQELNIETHLVVSTLGEYVVEHECGIKLEELKGLATHFHENKDLAAPIASGSFKTDAMVIVPCSMKTVSAVANGLSDNLLTRAADVIIKENRKLVVVPRETPLSQIHLENMLKLSRAGVTVLPPSPGFYSHPETIGDIVSGIVARILDQIGIEHNLITRWGE